MTQSEMMVVAVSAGMPREVTWQGRTVSTSFYKMPVQGPVMLRQFNLDGDRQADLSVHGGTFKAAYCYPVEHYAWWTGELSGRQLDAAMFGENFTTQGLDERSVHIGDRFSFGDAHVVVTQPRLPCFKLGVRFRADDMVKRFLGSGRSGFYLAVEREGLVSAGDPIAVLARDPRAVRVSDLARLYVAKHYSADDVRILQEALEIASLPDSWKDHFRERLR